MLPPKEDKSSIKCTNAKLVHLFYMRPILTLLPPLPRYFSIWFHGTNPTQKAKGASIAFYKTLPIEVLDVRFYEILAMGSQNLQ